MKNSRNLIKVEKLPATGLFIEPAEFLPPTKRLSVLRPSETEATVPSCTPSLWTKEFESSCLDIVYNDESAIVGAEV